MAEAYDWECPFCRRHTTITSAAESAARHDVPLSSRFAPAAIISTRAIRCPNSACRELYVEASLWACESANLNGDRSRKARRQLRPLASAKTFCEYVPANIRQDYEEACAVADLSPKASATLARRCLQAMIRDFWGIVEDRLFDEIKALKEKVDPATWQAIDDLRKLGNIGAHSEKNPGVIVDVEPGEAEALLKLIEILVGDWYDQREARKAALAEVRAIAEAKEQAKAGGVSVAAPPEDVPEGKASTVLFGSETLRDRRLAATTVAAPMPPAASLTRGSKG